MIRQPLPQFTRCLILPLILICIIVATVSCLPTASRFEGEELPFETIERKSTSDTGELYSSKIPRIVIIADPSGIAPLQGIISSSAIEQLLATDYNSHFALIAFLGKQDTLHEGITISEILFQDNDLTIIAQTGRKTGALEVTSPYHVTRISKTETWSWVDPWQVTLVVDGDVMFSKTQVISGSAYFEGSPLPTATPPQITPVPTKTPPFAQTP